ncbi:hypothetical protein CDAR_464591 [Caerostris darwini]|uniref:Uncharacterized protein n=1 Tax=Caerostris darwini TaxID=1538125 RepID=A0AAV4Q8T4_9ARAC|nr:hypothetical protein CDAR_464591 [Caerostris darwini]
MSKIRAQLARITTAKKPILINEASSSNPLKGQDVTQQISLLCGNNLFNEAFATRKDSLSTIRCHVHGRLMLFRGGSPTFGARIEVYRLL